jgi:hypothetical protein
VYHIIVPHGDYLAQDKLETCFVPAGFDTAELIRISSGVKHVPGEYQSRFKTDLARKVRTPHSTQASEEPFIY